jgi:hypothetical protein
VAAARTTTRLRSGAAEAVALTDGYRLAFTIGTLLLAASIVGAVFVLRSAAAAVPQDPSPAAVPQDPSPARIP